VKYGREFKHSSSLFSLKYSSYLFLFLCDENGVVLDIYRLKPLKKGFIIERRRRKLIYIIR